MMKTFKKSVGMVLMVLLAACTKDDAPPSQETHPENRPPRNFGLISPVQDELNEQPSPVFSWNTATDPDGDTVSYDLYLDTAEVPQTLIAEGLNTATFALEEHLDFETEYHWKVIAKDGKGAETESEIGSFTTDLPIAFLKKFNSGLEGPGSLTLGYDEGLLTDMAYEFGNSWQLDYDTASGKLSRTARELNGEFLNYSYGYTSLGKQKSIQLERSAKKESWILDYDGDERLTAVVYEFEQSNGNLSKATATLTYADENSIKPKEITLVTTHSDGSETTEIAASLEWEGENIISVVIEGTEDGEAFSLKSEYAYDNNINPYYILTKNQFGFGNFFVLDIRTGMESINLGPFYWQSPNNFVKMTLIETSVKGGSFTSTDTYEYSYSEDFYPLTAIRVYTGGMSVEETRALSWSY
jgi:hypothetical protein